MFSSTRIFMLVLSASLFLGACVLDPTFYADNDGPAPAYEVCCYDYDAYPAYGYGYESYPYPTYGYFGGPAVGLGYWGGGYRDYHHWR